MFVEDFAGKVFNGITVLYPAGRNGYGKLMCKARCHCGYEWVTMLKTIRNGRVRSCGCLGHRMGSGTSGYKHGLTNAPIFKVWRAMIDRCDNPNTKAYVDYGARGIRVCSFLRASVTHLIGLIGNRPDKMTLDRVNNDGHYSCGSCDQCSTNGWALNIRWASRFQQMWNTRVSAPVCINGQSKCVAEWSAITGISKSTIFYRIKKGWPSQELLLPTGSVSHPRRRRC